MRRKTVVAGIVAASLLTFLLGSANAFAPDGCLMLALDPRNGQIRASIKCLLGKALWIDGYGRRHHLRGMFVNLVDGQVILNGSVLDVIGGRSSLAKADRQREIPSHEYDKFRSPRILGGIELTVIPAGHYQFGPWGPGLYDKNGGEVVVLHEFVSQGSRLVFVIRDPRTHVIRRTFPGVYRDTTSGVRILTTSPDVAIVGDLFLTQRGNYIEATEMSSGRHLWSARNRLAWIATLEGAWLARGRLFVHTKRGLSRLDPWTGATIWTRPEINGWPTHAMEARNGLLYVVTVL